MNICKHCGKEFEPRPGKKGLYCSHPCSTSAKFRHGMGKTSEYNTWCSIKRRCYNPAFKDYPHYGARGIRVCDRWMESFDNFFADMGMKPSAKHSIDRIDNEGNYEPGNCRWATRQEQSRNRGDYNFSPEEDQEIRDAISEGLNFTQMAKRLGKTVGSISARTYRLGLRSGQPLQGRRMA